MFGKEKNSLKIYTKGPRPIVSSARILGTNIHDTENKVKCQYHIQDSKLCVFDFIVKVFRKS